MWDPDMNQILPEKEIKLQLIYLLQGRGAWSYKKRSEVSGRLLEELQKGTL
jgi:hypothetical protein